jgi:hypothetical protein
MKHFLFSVGAATLLSMFLITVQDAEAGRPTVHCEFSWAENPALNVKAGSKFRNKKVRTKEYNRLIAMGTVAVRVAADRGQRCQLNHPENTLIDTMVVKASYRLDPSGRIPNCADLNATVVCRGM